MLRVEGLTAGYTDEPVVENVTLEVHPGQVATIIGSNGAGKTTTLRAVVGSIRRRAGQVLVDGHSVGDASPRDLVRRGVALVPEGRGIFAGLSVAENLRLGAYTIRNRRQVDQRVDEILSLFPPLGARAGVAGSLLSGGEQQMLAIARALMSTPRYLLLDEPSMGLAPTVVSLLASILKAQAAEGRGVLLVEQNAQMALGLADQAYVLERGRVVQEGPAEELREDARVRMAYLGVA